jgi:hypothetical protein
MSVRTDNPIPVFKAYRTGAAVLSFLGWIGLAIAFFTDIRGFFAAYMFGFAFWMCLTLGSCTLTYLHHCIRATWSLALLRVAEAGNKCLPVMLVFLIPLLYGVYTHQLYQWSNPELVAKSELLQHKQWLLNPTGFTVWSIGLFAYWFLTTNYLNVSSRKQDETLDERLGQARASRAAPWGVLHVLGLTIAWTYWVMSLDPLFYSTIYGAWFMTYSWRLIIAIGTVIVLGLRFRRPYSESITPKLTKDIGNMLLGLTMFWAYMSISQFLIIWSGNLPQEITFYVNRFTGPMVFLGAFLIFAQFFIPFLALIAGRTKREPVLLLRVCLWIIFASVLDMFWQIAPFFQVFTSVNWTWLALDVAAFFALGGVWVWFFLSDLIKSAQANVLIPRHDTRLQEAKLDEVATHA